MGTKGMLIVVLEVGILAGLPVEKVQQPSFDVPLRNPMKQEGSGRRSDRGIR